mmetsp:Transcript_30036/g.39518  ORF Transcript_30036/g.39518 Transcript_30036/m.39518 type:complete len:292 (+) Transcript_30036:123-998(+)
MEDPNSFKEQKNENDKTSEDRDSFNWQSIEVQLEMLRQHAVGVSDVNLTKFLKFKGDVDRAVACLNEHRDFRAQNSWVDDPPLRATCDSEIKRILLSEVVTSPAQMIDKMGRPSLFIQIHKNDMTDGRTPRDIVRVAFYNIERLLNREEVLEQGVVLVYDLRGSNKKNFHLGVPKVIFPALSGGKIPIKVKAFYFISPPWVFKAFYAIASLFLSKKLKSRVQILNNVEQLLQYFGKENLPEVLGGTLQHDQKQWVENQIAEEESVPLLEVLVKTTERMGLQSGERSKIEES